MNQDEIVRFTALWTKAQPSVFALISATITNFSDAEDILQKVAAVAIEKFAEYDQSRSFIGWALGIARYEVLRYLRDRTSDKHQFIADSLNQITDAFSAIQPELDARREALSDCLERVEGRSRRVLQMRYAEEKKSGAIAKELGISSTNVSVILNRTYRSLRNCIEARLAMEAFDS